MTAELAPFALPGALKPKERPRVTQQGGGTYTPAATLEAEARVAWEFRRANRAHRPDKTTRWGLVIRVWPRTRHRQDVDNLAKTVLDGLNGVLYADDSQVDDLHIIRLWEGASTRPDHHAEVACYRLP